MGIGKDVENIILKEYYTLKEKIKIRNFDISIGIVKGKSKKRKKDKSEKRKIGVTNADILYILENGSFLQNIPPRPILSIISQYASYSGKISDIKKNLLRMIIDGNADYSQIKNYLSIEGSKLVSYGRDLIMSNEGWLAANAPSTAKRKWRKSRKSKKEKWYWPEGNHPLVDTGQLVNALNYKIDMY